MTAVAAPKVGDVSPVISLAGTALPQAVNDRLRSFRVERGVRQVGRAELTFADDGFALLEDHSSLFEVGKAVTVAASRDGDSTTVFQGVLTGIRADYLAAAWETGPVLTVVAEEETAELRHRQEAQVFTQMTMAQVVTRCCGAGGLSVSVASDAFPSTVHPTYLSTTSPSALLEDLCDTYGAEWWLEGSTLHVGKASSTGQVTVPLTQLVASLSMETRNSGFTEVMVRGWDRSVKKEVVGRQQGEVTGDDAAAKVENTTVGTPMGSPTRPVHTRARAMDGKDELDAYAKGIALAAARQRHELHLETEVMLPAVGPRTAINLTEAGALGGIYRTTSVVHSWDADGGRTKVFCGARPLAGLAPALRPPTGSRLDAGTLLVGLVTNISPSEAKDVGCVKVKFPTLGDNVEAAWARVVLPGAGKNRGFVVPHQVDDEVIVAFEEGDLQRPVVLGALHGGKASPPAATAPAQGKAPTAGLTSEKGHVVLVTDEAQQARNGILVKHAKGSSVLLNDNGVTVEGTQVPVTLKVGSASLVIDEKGNVTIKGMKVVLEGTTEVEIKAPTVKVTANAQLNLQSAGTAGLKADGTVEVSASGLTQVKGGLLKLN